MVYRLHLKCFFLLKSLTKFSQILSNTNFVWQEKIFMSSEGNHTFTNQIIQKGPLIFGMMKVEYYTQS